MAGSKASAQKARDTILARDPDHYKKMGKVGGRAKVPKGFAMLDKETLQELGRKVGKLNKDRRKPVLH